MNEIRIRARDGQTVRATLYEVEAPTTSAAFLSMLPLKLIFYNTRDTGTELLSEEGPLLRIPQENLSVQRTRGEIGIEVPTPRSAKRFKGRMSIIYGAQSNPRLCMNIFARVVEVDLLALETIGLEIWEKGFQEIEFMWKQK